MTVNRGAQIERFYWLVLNLIGKAFGYLMALAGGLFCLSFLSERLRTGEMIWDGRVLKTWPEQWPILLGGAIVFAIGLILVRLLPYERDEKPAETKNFGE